MSNIKYLGFAKATSSVPICGRESNEEDLKLEITKVLSKLKDFDLRQDERQKMKSQFGCWYCKKDARGVIYLALCSPNYPERHIYAAINQLRDHLSKLGDYETEPDSTLKLHSKDFIQTLYTNFQDLKGFDKVSLAGGLLNEVTADARKNTEQVVQNVMNMEALTEKSERVRERALLFEETAADVQHRFSRRKCTIRALIAVSALSLLLLIIIPIATKTVT